MPKYLVTYVGGGMPYDPGLMAQARAAFGARTRIGQHPPTGLIPGAPVRLRGRFEHLPETGRAMAWWPWWACRCCQSISAVPCQVR